jgi:cytochrome c oxidase subunit 1
VAVSTDTVQPFHADWRQGRVTSWLTTVDHKRIGILYIWTCLLFFALGGMLALLIRSQLLHPHEHFMTRSSYNQAVTIHGTTMIFLVIVPILAGFGNFLAPLMIGARDMAFPRLNALSYWLFLLGGVVMYASFFAKGGAAAAGWTSYAPLSTLHAPGRGQDVWILGLHILTLSSFAGAVNFIVTIHNMRAPGMTWMRMPLFVWAILTYAWMLVIVLPTLSAGLTMMLLDRQAGTHFFDPAHGGSPILYQHIFWFFGHPEVYIMILPAMGIVSEVLPVFARKPIFGYKAVAFSTVGIAFYSLLVWGHHMFAVGLPTGLDSFFMISSMVIAVPTGVKIFSWIATMWGGSIDLKTPMLWAIGFIFLFTVGGVTGVVLANAGVDYALHNTYYVVAHFHYVLSLGAVFSLFAGFYYWIGKMSGRQYNETFGKIHFWLTFIGVNLCFFPQHFLGLAGMPRRIADYPDAFAGWNFVSSIGAFISYGATLFFVFIVFHTLFAGRRVGANYWGEGATTLEWTVSSPPPFHSYDEVPVIAPAGH